MPTKQVIVMRADLNMPKGKIAAQAAHASMAFITRRLNPNCCYHPSASTIQFSKVEQEWLDNSYTKICVKVKSEDELLAIAEQATEAGLVCHVVLDNGTTMFDGVPTYTCLALGPDESDIIDQFTGGLPLL